MALRLAIGAIFKNEGPYPLEWIAYHRALGIERFFIADNATTTTRPRCSPPSTRPASRHLPFPDMPGRAAAAARLSEILRRHGAAADWIAFIDADEFLLPAPPLRSLPPAARGARPADPASGRSRSTGRSTARRPRAARPGPVIECFPAGPAGHPAQPPLQVDPAPAASPGRTRPRTFPLRAGFARCTPTAAR